MKVHLQREVDKLKKRLLSLSSLVEDIFQKSVLALERGDADLARSLLAMDDKVDEFEVEIEEDCLKVLALHQPVATDLRLIICVLKVNQSLERIGDMTIKIARIAEMFSSYTGIIEKYPFTAMADKTKAALKKSLDAFVNMQADHARDVCLHDAEINEMQRTINEQLKRDIREMPDNLELLLGLYEVARNLERIADHARSIAEDVIYLVDADIVRHKSTSATTGRQG